MVKNGAAKLPALESLPPGATYQTPADSGIPCSKMSAAASTCSSRPVLRSNTAEGGHKEALTGSRILIFANLPYAAPSEYRQFWRFGGGQTAVSRPCPFEPAGAQAGFTVEYPAKAVNLAESTPPINFHCAFGGSCVFRAISPRSRAPLGGSEGIVSDV